MFENRLVNFCFAVLFIVLGMGRFSAHAQDYAAGENGAQPSMPMEASQADQNEIDPLQMIAIDSDRMPSEANAGQTPYARDVNINDAFDGGTADFSGILESYQSFQKLRPDEPLPSEVRSFLFTTWQYALLQEAKREFLTRDPNAPDLTQEDVPLEERPRGIRELSLSGILFTSADRWIVWLNGMRVTPEAIPEQVIDIKVNSKFVELLWYDGFTQLIFPVRLRPHQRFNLDARLFLPGTAPL